ncbi:hypothetical protein [Flavobacterium sp.]|jgi:hypothetical protein|uniref:hypothetical protein n=1 Tax=Flavobacterium sp. TaxID=239 RepID=UPI0037C0EA0F
MPLRLRSAGGGSVLLKPPVAQAADVSMEVPAYDGAKLLTDMTPGVVLQQYLSYVPQGSLPTFNDTYSNAPTLANTSQYTTLLITPKKANSTFIIEFKGNIDADGGAAGSGEFVTLFVGSTLVGLSYQYRRTSGSEPVMHMALGSYTPGNATPFTLSLRVKSSTSYNMFFNRLSTLTTSDKNCYFKITEIAG